MKGKLFAVILGLSALFIAGCAAFFSVTGLGQLFAGASVAVITMAASLEVGKLVAASYLHRMWDKINKGLRVYLLIGVITLILITSGGIFGFLSNAYEQSAISRGMVDNQIEVLESRKSNLSADFDRWESRINVLTEQRTAQQAQYDSLTSNNHWTNASRVYRLIEDANDEIKTLNNQISANRDSIAKIDNEILNVKSENIDTEREIGGFRFIAKMVGGEIDKVVQWFIFALIFVFDPLAVTLVIAFNTLVYKNDTTMPSDTESVLEPTGDTSNELNEDAVTDDMEAPETPSDLKEVMDDWLASQKEAPDYINEALGEYMKRQPTTFSNESRVSIPKDDTEEETEIIEEDDTFNDLNDLTKRAYTQSEQLSLDFDTPIHKKKKPSSKRIDIIGQNGNDGLHYEKKKDRDSTSSNSSTEDT